MLYRKDPPENKRPTKTESEGLETNIPSKWTEKKLVIILYQKNRL